MKKRINSSKLVRIGDKHIAIAVKIKKKTRDSIGKSFEKAIEHYEKIINV